MTYNETHTGPLDPFGGAHFNSALPGPGQGFPHTPGPAERDAKTLATLSIVFAFVFAPVGAVLGHLALSQIKHGKQQGRDRALIGLTLSYVFILFAVVALLLWAINAQSRSSSTTTAAPSAAVPTQAAAIPDIQTTVITPPPPARRTVNVEDLRAGDCVEIQQTQPDPNNADTQLIKIYPVNCEPKDGVFRVDVVSSSTNPCTDEYLANRANTVFACITKFKG
jgi:Domain of unknown function (DUF4190)